MKGEARNVIRYYPLLVEACEVSEVLHDYGIHNTVIGASVLGADGRSEVQEWSDLGWKPWAT